MATNEQGVVSTTASADLHTHFHAQKQDILQACETPGASLSHIARLIQDLRKLVDSYGEGLPKYDRGRYTEELNGLDTKLSTLRTKDKPKSRFAFAKSKRPLPAKATPQSPTVVAGPSTDREETSPNVERSPINTHTIEGRSSALVRPELAPGTGTYTLSLSSVSHCLIDLRPCKSPSSTDPSQSALPVLTTLHAKKLTRCVLLAPVLPGSAMLSDLDNCLVVVGAQQFRMHSSTKTKVLLNVASLPVIEHSQNLTFGPYPDLLLPQTPDYVSKHTEVQDFDWVRGGQSPNWSLLAKDDVPEDLLVQLSEQLDGGMDDRPSVDIWIDCLLVQ
ncbi:hypothetical protein L198_03379 [Cryptococcus wingfieldii CBS 7118]|uniref:C-CAP/cofactor C-like domain-containing protein n=1 Tax=Cryptococcus wingfieldii CBS 7118 TaxID=1295528 RepID=A0A1E3JFU8_9TREE|nr:hypothetical protein L198_03379 [Cryptococcus wingfieldii CBS 7118]ODN99535.1 hypothetical protein L198_03379 [Cryptococcus wingfieldii CBS 7118]